MNLLLSNVDDELRRQLLAYGQRHDLQTGLLNYLSFQQSLVNQLRDGADSQEIALIWIDLLNLRREFSLWGWTGAEALVRHVAGTLLSVADTDALLGRFSGRSFLIAMRGAKFDKADRRRIQAVVDALSPLRVRGAEIRPEVAAGVAFYPSDTASPEDLVRFASLAATRAGYVKSPSVMSFHSGMNNLIMRDHQLEVEMAKGLDRGQFSVFYQPKIDLLTGRVLGAEALSRWIHPEWGFVTPGEFIPIAERSDLIHRIFDFCVRTALNDTRHWRDLGLSLPLITVNASPANVRSDHFAESVRAVLSESRISPGDLELEMTESLLIDDEDLFTERVRELKETGVRIAIDDFGTRYTGFNVLKRLPLDTMKIDKCFIRGIDRSQDMRALCQTIVAMARQLKLRTVAEGVEEPGELEAIQDIGCDAGQGFLFQRPVSAAEFTVFLREWPGRMPVFGFTQFQDKPQIDPLYGIA